MRLAFGLALALSLALALAAKAAAAPEDREGMAVPAGFKKTLIAETLPGTLPKARETKAVFASVKVTAEVGED